MAHPHEVKAGETLLSIADHYGFSDWKTIWEHEQNGPLRDRRADPQRLFPGDSVFIPDKAERWVRVATNQKHVFELRTTFATLKVALEDRFGQALVRRPYRVTADGTELEGRTDDAGVLQVAVPAKPAQWVTIELPEEELCWHVEVGTLYPIVDEDLKGAQAVLQNLGFLGPFEEDVCSGKLDEDTSAALGKFQEHYKLEQTKRLDEKTRAKLEELTYLEA